MRVFMVILMLMAGNMLIAQDTLMVQLQKKSFMPGDTISFTAEYAPWKLSGKTGTLNLWMEDVHHTAFWRLRYPILKGEAMGDIVLPENFPADMYSCYFSLQDDFFSMSGQVVSNYKDKAIKITMMLADKELLAQSISLDANKEFKIKRILFAERAKVFFSPIKQNRTNDLDIDLHVSIDSTFEPVDDFLAMLNIGNVSAGPVANEYKFNPNIFTGGESSLPGVEVIGKKQTPQEKFEEQRVTGMFKTSDAYTFDGMNSNQFIGWANILDWLRGRVAGLRIQPTGNGVDYTAQWQGGETFFFLNEMQVDAQTLTTVPTADIAYIKVFRPPFYGAYLGGAGGAIGIYTKDGSDMGMYGSKRNFLVNGYTPETFTLPVKAKE